MIPKIEDITAIDDNNIKSALAYVDPVTISNLLEICDNNEVKNKILGNLSDETRKKINLHNRAFTATPDDKEKMLKSFISILNRVMNFR
ncbi:MAG: FliG C-terminal domain-containing protein [Candidatus Muiribacteriaceae bacterium]